jgi:uncharacterized membrane protein
MSPIPLVILALLVVPYLAGLILGRLRNDPGAAYRMAVVGLALAFLFFGIGHFVIPGALVVLLPPWVPAREALVYATGIVEIAIGVGLLLPRWRRAAGWAALAALILFFPANVWGALNAVDSGGHALGPVYLLIRGPLQLLLIGWTWWFVLRRKAGRTGREA